MTSTDVLVDELRSRAPRFLRVLEIAAVAGTFDRGTLEHLTALEAPDLKGQDVFGAVSGSPAVRHVEDHRWTVVEGIRQALVERVKSSGNGQFARIHTAVAKHLGGGALPAAAGLAERLDHLRWLYHHVNAGADGVEVATSEFERSYDEGWVGDSSAIVHIVREAQPEAERRDPEFAAAVGLDAYREKRLPEARGAFRQLWRMRNRPRTRLIAIALHLHGLLSQDRKPLDESIAIGDEIPDRLHVAQVLHTRGQLRGRWDDRDGALGDLDRSVGILREVGDRFGEAQVLHTRGQLRGEWDDEDGALGDLDTSVAMGEDIGNRFHVAQVLHTRGQLRGEWDDKDGALRDLDRSLAMEREIGDKHGEAQVLHTRGQLRGRWDDKDGALRDLDRSLAMEREIGDKHGEAKVLNTRASLRIVELESDKRRGITVSTDVTEKALEDIVASLVRLRRPRNLSTGFQLLHRVFLLREQPALAAASLERQQVESRKPGGGGARWVQRAERRLRELTQSLSAEEREQGRQLLAKLLRDHGF